MTASYLIETLSKDRLKDKTTINNTVVKGHLIKSSIESIKTIYGENGLNDIISRLEIPQQIALKKRININEWYPIHLLIDLNLQVKLIYSSTDNTIFQNLGAIDFDLMFNSFEKIGFKFLSTPTILGNVAKKLNAFIKPAVFNVESLSTSHANILISNFFDPSHLMVKRIEGLLSAVLAHTGKSTVSVQIQESDTDYSYHISCIW